LGDNRYYTNFLIALKQIKSRKEKKKLRQIAISYFFHQIYEAIIKDTKLANPSYLRRKNILGYAFNFQIKFASQTEIVLGLGGSSHIYIANKVIGQSVEEGQILSPVNHSASIILGNHLYTLGHLSEAIDTFGIVIKYSSNPEELHAAWVGKSQCYRMLANHKKEIQCINKALTYKITREALLNKVLYFETIGKTDEANKVRSELNNLS
jgi:tetratricopeptide (TPR) repeat protein